VLALLGILGNLFLGIGGNFGLPFGYYGKLNQTLQELRRIPGVQVAGVGLHKDMTLEDFWITIEIDGATEELEFLNANIRTIDDLSREFAHLLDSS
jgi:hypothetical protein